jgi:hypothetical protein
MTRSSSDLAFAPVDVEPQVEVVKLLLDKSANLAATDQSGFLALDWAIAVYLQCKPEEGAPLDAATAVKVDRIRGIVRTLTVKGSVSGSSTHALNTTQARLDDFPVAGLLAVPGLRGGAGARFDAPPPPPGGSLL